MKHQASDALLKLKSTGEDETPIEYDIPILFITPSKAPKMKKRCFCVCKTITRKATRDMSDYLAYQAHKFEMSFLIKRRRMKPIEV